MPTFITFTALAIAQSTAYRQLDELQEVCRVQDREYVEPLQVKRQFCQDAWFYWQEAMQDGSDPAPPDVPNLSWTECELVRALYCAQQQ